MGVSSIRQLSKYHAIKSSTEILGYSIQIVCEILGVNRSSYYKWLGRNRSKNEIKNEILIDLIKTEYESHDGILGYRQMTTRLRRVHNHKVNRKRVYRLMRALGIRSVCRRKRKKYIKSTPEITAENVLNREFQASNIHKKWLTDVTEFKYGIGKKAYLTAILDLGDKSIVSYEIGHSNNNALVFKMFDKAVSLYPQATPIFHSDRGYQYTSRSFKAKLENAGMTQSMSRVGRCIDNGPMECFWGILKSEMYYIRKYHDFESLKSSIENYIQYYNHERYQLRLNEMTPIEYREHLLATAA